MVRGKVRRRRLRFLSPLERAAVQARFREGARIKEVMAEFALSHSSAHLISQEAALMRRRVLHSPHRLSFEERERIFVGVHRGESDSEIARAWGGIARRWGGRSAGAVRSDATIGR